MSVVTPEALLSIFQKICPFTIQPQRPIEGISVDSRVTKQGDLFFALPGAKTDGHQYVQEALQRGAIGIVSKHNLENLPEGVGLLMAEDVLHVLQSISREVLAYVSPRTVAITGSLGKSTTKEFTKTLLQACGSTVATEGSCNSQIGLAMSSVNGLMKEKEPVRWFVAEMGMSEKGQIANLVTIVPPEICLVTNIAPVHVQYFSSVQEIAKAKAEIFSSPRCRISLINKDSPYVEVLEKSARGEVKTLSMKEKASYSLAIEESSLLFEHEGKRIRFPKPAFPARHQFENLLHALALACEAGGDVHAFSEALSALKMLPKRLEFIEKAGVRFINDSYNASECSMMSALDVLKTTSGKRKVALLGQMRELGSFSIGCHERVGRKAREVSDLLICLGEECGPLYHAFQESGKPSYWASSLGEIHALLPTLIQEEDVVLLKGSKSNKLWEVVEQFSRGSDDVSTH